ncbi:MAG: adenylyltransferase/cytidyltransferase family protein [Candidatus Pacebacteria bacterium]|nr:adenylyltransferase/cytidyltransferase family protein [Candidatus Paceibacterota bacterium]
MPRKPVWVAVSGGFDPLHIGHVRMLQEARKLGDKLVVILNNDHWLRSKKGFVFMPQKERAEIIRAFPYVDKVVLTDHKKNDPDRSVCRALTKLKPQVFANGGDRFAKNIPEAILCKQLGIKTLFNVGAGGKVQSSSWMIRDASKNFMRSVRPWGEFYGWDDGKSWKLKTIHIKAGKRLSLQYHNHRSELWTLVEGDAIATIHADGKERRIPLVVGQMFAVPVRAVHRLESKKGGVIVEIGLGDFDENDIVRLEDDHGRT